MLKINVSYDLAASKNRVQSAGWTAGKVVCAATKVAAIEVSKASMKVALKAAKGEDACATRIAKLDAEFVEMKKVKEEQPVEAVDCGQPKEIKKEAPKAQKAQKVVEEAQLSYEGVTAYADDFFFLMDEDDEEEAVKKAQPKEIKEEKKEAATVDQLMNDDKVEANADTFIKLMDKEAEEAESAEDEADADEADERANAAAEEKVIEGDPQYNGCHFSRPSAEEEIAGYPRLYCRACTEGMTEEEKLVEYILTVNDEVNMFMWDYKHGYNTSKGDLRYCQMALSEASDACTDLWNNYRDVDSYLGMSLGRVIDYKHGILTGWRKAAK